MVNNLVSTFIVDTFLNNKAKFARLYRNIVPRKRYTARNHPKLLSHHKRFVWFKIPKVATTSIETAFRNNDRIYGIRRIKQSPEVIADKYPDYFKFAFVRNPWSRVVSCYVNKICYPQKRSALMYFSRYKSLYYRMPFEEFIYFLCSEEGKDENADPHWISQHLFLYDGSDCMVDFVGRFENLEQDLRSVCNGIGIDDLELPHITPPKQTNKQHYRDYYNERTYDLVLQRYRKDVELFDYRS